MGFLCGYVEIYGCDTLYYYKYNIYRGDFLQCIGY